MAKLLLVDGMSILKSVASLVAGLTNGHAHSFLMQVNSAIKERKVDGVILCWEDGTGDRKELSPDYKRNRVRSPEQVIKSREIVKRFYSLCGIPSVICDGHEADDAIAELTASWVAIGGEVIIMSNDYDFRQLVSSRVSLLQRIRVAGKGQKVLLTPKNLLEFTGLPSGKHHLEYKLFAGDGSDQVKKSVTASDPVIRAFLLGMLEESSSSFRELTAFKGSETWELNRRLMDLTRFRGLKMSMELPERNLEAAEAFTTEHSLNTVVKQLPKTLAAIRGMKFTHADFLALPGFRPES